MSHADAFYRAKFENEKAIIRKETELKQQFKALFPGSWLTVEQEGSRGTEKVGDFARYVRRGILFASVILRVVRITDKIRKVFTS